MVNSCLLILKTFLSEQVACNEYI